MEAKLKVEIMSDDIELLTIQETASKLRISKPYLYKLMKKKEIESIKIGKRTFFTKEAIRAFLDKNKI